LHVDYWTRIKLIKAKKDNPRFLPIDNSYLHVNLIIKVSRNYWQIADYWTKIKLIKATKG
jgi:hypothetical protein